MTDRKNKLKIAIISGAAHALKYKQESPGVSDEEILRKITKNSSEILEKIESDEGGSYSF